MSSARILIVEPDTQLRRLLAGALMDHGCGVLLCGTGAEALDYARNEAVSVAIIELILPDGNGLEVARAIRTHHINTDVVLLTSEPSVASATEALRLGAFEYLPKPVDVELIVRTVRRIFEQQELARETERLRAETVHADRLRTVSLLAAGATHEINNPASFVLANLDHLKSRLPSLLAQGTPPETVEEFRQVIDESLSGMRRIESLAGALRAFSRTDEHDVGWISMDDLVRAALNVVRCQIRHRAALESDLGDVPHIAGQRGRLAHVISTLLASAMEGIDENAERESEIRISTWNTPDDVVLTVRDNGVGMPQESVERAFEPFVVTRRGSRGAGVALSSVRQIVEDHRGSVALDSEVGRGTRVEVRIPKDTGLEVSRPLPQSSTPSPRVRVLLVDDEPALLHAYRRMLEGDFDVVVAGGGRDALRVLAADDGIDVILSDLMMPDVDGVALFDELSAHYPDLRNRVLFMTAGGLGSRYEAFAREHEDLVLEKPIEPSRLRANVRRVVDKTSEPPPRIRRVK